MGLSSRRSLARVLWHLAMMSLSALSTCGCTVLTFQHLTALQEPTLMMSLSPRLALNQLSSALGYPLPWLFTQIHTTYWSQTEFFGDGKSHTLGVASAPGHGHADLQHSTEFQLVDGFFVHHSCPGSATALEQKHVSLIVISWFGDVCAAVLKWICVFDFAFMKALFPTMVQHCIYMAWMLYLTLRDASPALASPPYATSAWLRDERQRWRLCQWNRIARDRPEVSDIEKGILIGHTLKHLQYLGACPLWRKLLWNMCHGVMCQNSYGGRENGRERR